MVDLPKKVRVSAFDFDIVEWGPTEAALRQRFGEFCAMENQIRVLRDG